MFREEAKPFGKREIVKPGREHTDKSFGAEQRHVWTNQNSHFDGHQQKIFWLHLTLNRKKSKTYLSSATIHPVWLLTPPSLSQPSTSFNDYVHFDSDTLVTTYWTTGVRAIEPRPFYSPSFLLSSRTKRRK